MTKFGELQSQHIASSVLKQQKLSEFLGEHSWDIDLDTGKVDFGRGRIYALQVLGTESEGSATWLWGWANEASNIPASLLSCASTLRSLGEKEAIEELVQPQLPLDRVDGHTLSLVASGVCAASAYYRGPYPGGALFFLLPQVPQSRAASAAEIINVMSSVISQWPVDHRIMARSFLQQQGFELAPSEAKLVATATDGREITVGFDALGRISGMETTMSPAAAPQAAAKKPWWQLGK